MAPTNKLSFVVPPHVPACAGWSEILYQCAENCRTMRLEYKLGGTKDATPLRTWSVTVAEGVGIGGETEPEFSIHGDFGEEFRGNTTDLSRALYYLVDQQSRSFRVGDDRTPKRVTWTLHLLGSDHQTLDSRGADWKPNKIPEVEQDQDDDSSSLVEHPVDDRQILLQIIRDQRTRIRELEELDTIKAQQLVGAIGSITEQSTKLMDAHTANALAVSEGVVHFAGQHFDLMIARLEVDLSNAQEPDFLDSPAGQIVMQHLPGLLDQAPELISAIAQWLLTAARQKAATGTVAG